ncbi:MAG: hypothetical protein IKI20_01555 [Lachnospiraceae bacterium]|nr:hypothetical protein [Lachnospiraceae bacterium]
MSDKKQKEQKNTKPAQNTSVSNYKQIKKEIKMMLLGNLVPSGKYLEVSDSILTGVSRGMTDGADRVLFFGVMRHTRYYKTELNPNRARDLGHKGLMEIGRKVILKSNPNAETVICRFMVTSPIVLYYEVDEIGVNIETYTGRGIPGLFSELWIRNTFFKKMPKELRESLVKMSKPEVLAKRNEIDSKDAREIAKEQAKALEEQRLQEARELAEKEGLIEVAD